MNTIQRSRIGQIAHRVLRSRLSYWFPIFLLLVSCGGGGSSTTDEEFVANGDKADEQVILLRYLGNDVLYPAYLTFEQSTVELSGSIQTFCGATIDSEALTILRDSWRQSMDAWQEIQMMRFGPITNDNYLFRIQFWPDDNNAVENNVANLLLNSQVLTEELIANSSVGAQGIPALEYLIFGNDNVIIGSFNDVDSGSRRCELITAISTNLNTIASDLSRRWAADGEDFLNDFIGTGVLGSGDTSRLDENLSDIVNTMIEQAQFIFLSKLQAPFGDVLPGNLEAAESWRSRYSKQNLLRNLKFLQKFYGPENTGFSRYLNQVVEADILDENMRVRFADLIAQVELLPGDLEQAIASQEQREIFAVLVEQMNSLVTKLEGDFASAMNATVGFNGNDGD